MALRVLFLAALLSISNACVSSRSSENCAEETIRKCISQLDLLNLDGNIVELGQFRQHLKNCRLLRCRSTSSIEKRVRQNDLI